MLYWPLAGRVIRVKLALADVVMLVKVVPSGFLRTKAADPIVFCVKAIVTTCPALPVKVKVAFCPGVAVATLWPHHRWLDRWGRLPARRRAGRGGCRVFGPEGSDRIL